MQEIILGGPPLTLNQLVAVGRHHAPARLAPEVTDRVKAARELIETWVSQGRVVYGVTTGFGGSL